MLKVIFLSFLFVFLTNGQKASYDNYHVFEVLPQSEDQLKFLIELDETSDSVNFLDGVHFVNKKAVAVVAPHKVPEFIDMLSRKEISHHILFDDLQKHLDSESEVSPRSSSRSGYDWSRYHTLEETYQWLQSLAKQHPNIVQVIKVGRSYEGRDLLGVKISYKQSNKGIFIEAGIHAREWISPAAVTYIINELLTSKDAKVRDIAENYDWYIVPHTNPDGYVYTHNKDRLWRKTRSPQGSCYGVDPNRNWNYHWNEAGSSSSPCTETYAGKSANSEIEIKTLSDYIASLRGKIHIYLSFHSYSQLLLFPYGYTRQHVKNHNDLQRIGDAAANALSKRYGTKYTVGNIYDTIYPASGSSIDWAYGTLNIPLAYTYELRPKGGFNGFVLPPKQIVPTSEETLDSLIALIAEAKKLGY